MAAVDRGGEILASMHLDTFSYGNTTEDEMIVEDYPYNVHTKEDMQYERIAAAFCIMFIATILITYLTVELSNCIKKSSWLNQQYNPSDEHVVIHVQRAEFGFPPAYCSNDQQTTASTSGVQSETNNVTPVTNDIVDITLPADLSTDEMFLRLQRTYGIGAGAFLNPPPSYNQIVNDAGATETV
uniref:Uncharacterized protein n=1 Tax=Plectus sambesii TaxID=2011161 RepID=A0A914XMV1_9BILA